MSDESREVIALALSAYSEGRIDDALGLISEAILTHPDNCDLHLYRAQTLALLETPDWDAIVDDCTQALKHCTSSDNVLEALNLRVIAYDGLGQQVALLEDLKRLRGMNELDSDGYGWLARIIFRTGGIREAMEVLNEGLHNSPHNARLLLQRAQVNALQGAYSEAVVDFSQVIDAEAVPSSERLAALYGRGKSLFALHEHVEAYRDLTEVRRSGTSHIWDDLDSIISELKGILGA